MKLDFLKINTQYMVLKNGFEQFFLIDKFLVKKNLQLSELSNIHIFKNFFDLKDSGVNLEKIIFLDFDYDEGFLFYNNTHILHPLGMNTLDELSHYFGFQNINLLLEKFHQE